MKRIFRQEEIVLNLLRKLIQEDLIQVGEKYLVDNIECLCIKNEYNLVYTFMITSIDYFCKFDEIERLLINLINGYTTKLPKNFLEDIEYMFLPSINQINSIKDLDLKSINLGIDWWINETDKHYCFIDKEGNFRKELKAHLRKEKKQLKIFFTMVKDEYYPYKY